MQTFLRRALAFMLKLSQRTTDPLFLKSVLDNIMCCLMPTSDCCCNFILGFGVIPNGQYPQLRLLTSRNNMVSIVWGLCTGNVW